ncbi:site-specific integrase [Halioxenophilus sp. WMMB6]|uniref:tyrosine-type recombinase/integrase n=1 Tax=Halioxenophilus sp. WMMB6 TaxID=3073815 RepID=UPI00295F1170|nr:site-specific integrase [Halioxenophilus sp. WMMB6]
MNEEISHGNPAQIAKKDCRYFIADAQVKEVRRLTQEQWQYVLEAAETMANSDPLFERNLFIIAALKGLFLRVSELSERSTWSPTMNHFWQDEDGNWWLKVFGKGRKLRDVSVPTQFLSYLVRYRRFRGLADLPSSSDYNVLVEKIRGQGGMTTRHLTRLVQEVFDRAQQTMTKEKGPVAAEKLKEASTHWLRHTGASMEVERGRALKDLSEDLGHASMATTDTVYVQSEHKRRAKSGKDRSI